MQVILNSPGYTYDVHSLVAAFFPQENISIVTDAKEFGNTGCMNVFVSSGDVKGNDNVSGMIRVTLPSKNGVITCERQYENADRPSVKNHLKQVIYEALSKLTGQTFPWGTMTGIRPTKVPMKMIREGSSDEEIKEYMRSVYLCSDEKITLATQIAHREKQVIDGLSDKGFSLYIGIPFCPTTCLYCSFTSYPIVSWKDRCEEYLAALKKELDFFSQYYKGRKCDSIYIGGGTPTTLSARQLSDIIAYVLSRFDTSALCELTVEAGRPDSITVEKMKALKDSGVTRISVNPQTMNEKTLKIIGRRHTVEDVYSAFDVARAAGFSNINTDLILGLPGEDENDVRNTFDKIKELAPDSITVHSMAIKRAAGMHSFLEQHPDIRTLNTKRMMDMAHDLAASLGLEAYYLYRQKNMTGNFENVGFAKKENYGIYNIAIMEEVSDIAAAGAGTISKRVFPHERIERIDNVKDVALYIDRIEEMIDRKRKLFDQNNI